MKVIGGAAFIVNVEAKRRQSDDIGTTDTALH